MQSYTKKTARTGFCKLKSESKLSKDAAVIFQQIPQEPSNAILISDKRPESFGKPQGKVIILKRLSIYPAAQKQCQNIKRVKLFSGKRRRTLRSEPRVAVRY